MTVVLSEVIVSEPELQCGNVVKYANECCCFSRCNVFGEWFNISYGPLH